MGIISNRVKRSEIKSGDHIYTYRAGYAYSHHGGAGLLLRKLLTADYDDFPNLLQCIFVGGGKVVHLTARRKEKNSGSDTSVNAYGELSNLPSSCPNFPDCGFRKPDSGVAVICLDCFLRDGSPYRYEYGVTPSVLLAQVRGGTCTIATSDPPEEVIARAMYLFQNGFGNYDVCRNNCEDFALYCKTRFLIIDRDRVGRSGQATSVIGSSLAALLSLPLKLLMPTQVGLATVTAGMICMTRYATDIGVRSDVIKVPVEELALNLGWGEIDEKNGAKMRALKSKLSTDIGVRSAVIKVPAEELTLNLGWGEIDEKNGEKMRALKSELSTNIGVWSDVLKVVAEDLAVNVCWGGIDEKNGRALKRKLSTDIGVWSDVLKAAAEDLAMNLGWGEIDEKNGSAVKSKWSTDIGVWSDVLKEVVEDLAVNLVREEIDEKNGEKMRALKSKLSADIGVWSDVLKVDAEDLAKNLVWWGEINKKKWRENKGSEKQIVSEQKETAGGKSTLGRHKLPSSADKGEKRTHQSRRQTKPKNYHLASKLSIHTSVIEFNGYL